MKSKLFAIAGLVAVTALSTTAYAASTTSTAPATPTKQAAKLIEIKTCPISGEKVVGKGAGSEVVGNYKVYFCCAGCQPKFDKLTKAQKLAKVVALAKASKAK
jgi:hypothetical protein